MDDRSPGWGDDDEAERRRWAQWADQQRTGWWTPAGQVRAFLGPVSPRIGLVAILVVFLVFLAISYAMGDTAFWGSRAATERVTDSVVHGLDEAQGVAYGELMHRYGSQNQLADAEWLLLDTSDGAGYYRVEWSASEPSGTRSIGFQVTDDRHHRVRVERLTLDELEAVVRSVLGDDAAARFRAAAEVS